jgi:hypothetical protein
MEPANVRPNVRDFFRMLLLFEGMSATALAHMRGAPHAGGVPLLVYKRFVARVGGRVVLRRKRPVDRPPDDVGRWQVAVLGRQLEDMDRLGVARDCQEGRHGVEGHVVDLGGVGAAPELGDLVAVGDGEDTDDGALVRGGGDGRPGLVEGDEGERCLVGLDDVGDAEGEGIEEQDVACPCLRGRDGGSSGRRREGRVGGNERGGVGQVAVFGRGRQRTNGCFASVQPSCVEPD